MTNSSPLRKAYKPAVQPTPVLTREAYIDLLGGALPPACHPQAKVLKTESFPDHVRQTVRLRLLSNHDAAIEHPELALLDGLLKDFAKPEKTPADILNLYKQVAQLDERMQYNYDNPEFLPTDLANLQAVMEKFPLESAHAFVKELYRKTLDMYTHTEAFILYPRGARPGEKRPAILVHHQHCAQYKTGKSETVGIAIEGQGNPIHATANELVKAGYIVVAYDQLGFETRQHPVRSGLQWERWRSNGLENNGKTLLRSYLADAVGVVDYMTTLPGIDANRIGVYGHSLGSWVSVNLAMLDDRIRAVVGNCGFPTTSGLQSYPAQYHCEPHSIPGIHKFGGFESIFQIREKPIALHMNFGGLDALNNEGAMIGAVAKNTLSKIPGSFVTCFVDEFQAHTNSPSMKDHAQKTFRWALKPNRVLLPLDTALEAIPA